MNNYCAFSKQMLLKNKNEYFGNELRVFRFRFLLFSFRGDFRWLFTFSCLLFLFPGLSLLFSFQLPLYVRFSFHFRLCLRFRFFVADFFLALFTVPFLLSRPIRVRGCDILAFNLSCSCLGCGRRSRFRFVFFSSVFRLVILPGSLLVSVSCSFCFSRSLFLPVFPWYPCLC